MNIINCNNKPVHYLSDPSSVQAEKKAITASLREYPPDQLPNELMVYIADYIGFPTSFEELDGTQQGIEDFFSKKGMEENKLELTFKIARIGLTREEVDACRGINGIWNRIEKEIAISYQACCPTYSPFFITRCDDEHRRRDTRLSPEFLALSYRERGEQMEKWLIATGCFGGRRKVGFSMIPPAILLRRDRTYLNLSHTILRTVSGIGALQQLVTLNLKLNDLTELPSEVGTLAKLEDLNVSHNQLYTLPATLGNLKALRFLELSNNRLTQITFTFHAMARLRELDLSGNKLSQLPAGIGNCQILRILVLTNNELTTLPEEIASLSQLERLQVEFNQLEALPTQIGELRALQILDANDNQLTELPETIGQLQKLRRLSVYNNKLRTLPAQIAFLNLDYLILTGNKLSKLLEELQKKMASCPDKQWCTWDGVSWVDPRKELKALVHNIENLNAKIHKWEKQLLDPKVKADESQVKFITQQLHDAENKREALYKKYKELEYEIYPWQSRGQ